MLLSKHQQHRFWRDWSVACHRQGWIAAQSWTNHQIEKERHSLLQRAGFDSLTKVDPLKGFDRVLAELALLIKPDDLNAQLRQKNMPRIRLLHSIRSLDARLSLVPSDVPGISAYTASILRDLYGHADLDILSDDQLENVRNILANRDRVHRRHPQPANCPF
jgi:hypothetical protein